jgi:hypothetical protein
MVITPYPSHLRICSFPSPASHATLRLRFSCFDFVMASDQAAHTIECRSCQWISATDRARAIGLLKRQSKGLTWNSLLPLVLYAALGAPSTTLPWPPWPRTLAMCASRCLYCCLAGSMASGACGIECSRPAQRTCMGWGRLHTQSCIWDRL